MDVRSLRAFLFAMSTVDFAIITALPEELRAVCAALGTVEEVHRDDADIRYYYRSRLTARDGVTIEVICACATEMGQQPASNLTRDVIAAWQPRHMLLVGIAGGFPERSVTHGDLIVPTQVHYYEPGKLLHSGTEDARIPRWRTFRPSKRLLAAVDALALEATTTWMHRVTEARPSSAADPRVLRGDLASGEEVWGSLKATTAREVLQRSDKILAVENEAAGMCSAVEELPDAPDALIIKGISDLVEAKSDHWRAYAASTAAAFVVALMEKVGARWRMAKRDVPDEPLQEAWDAMNDARFADAATLAEAALDLVRGDTRQTVRCHRQAVRAWGEHIATGHLAADDLRHGIARIRAGIEAIETLEPDAPFLALEHARLALFERNGARAHALSRRAIVAAEEESADWVDALIFFHHACWLLETPDEALSISQEMDRACALTDSELRLVAATTRLRTLLKTDRASPEDTSGYADLVRGTVEGGLAIRRAIEVAQQVAWDLRRGAPNEQCIIVGQLLYDLAERAQDAGRAGATALELAELLAATGAAQPDVRQWIGRGESWLARLRDDPTQVSESSTLGALVFFTKGRILSRFAKATTDFLAARDLFNEATTTLAEAEQFATTYPVRGDVGLFLAEVRNWRAQAEFELGHPVAAASLFAQVHSDAALANPEFARHVASAAWLAEAENRCLSGDLGGARRVIDAMIGDPRAKAWWQQAHAFRSYLSNHLQPTVEWLGSADADAVSKLARRTSLREAVRTQLQPLLRWWKMWSTHESPPYTEFLDFWSRGGFLRLAAAIRGRPQAAIAVDARSIEEIRLWTRVLCPLFETVIVKWKGELGAGMVLVPMDVEYGGPGAVGGHGYMVCAASGVNGPEGAEWTVAMGWANPLPQEIARFLATEAIGLVASGRLIVLPAALAGCTQTAVGWTDHLLVDALMGNVVDTVQVPREPTSAQRVLDLSNVTLPYIADVPLDDLATGLDEVQDELSALQSLIFASLGSDDLRQE
jgi:nucleoside phosphorylase